MPERESPAVEWMQRMRAAFMNAITEDDMRALAKGLMARAKDGDRDAVRFILTFSMPPQATEHRRLSVQANVQSKAPPHYNGRVIDAPKNGVLDANAE